jgi:hypothetical protein
VSRQEEKMLSMCERDTLNENKISYEDGYTSPTPPRLSESCSWSRMTRFVVKSSGETSLMDFDGVWFY